MGSAVVRLSALLKEALAGLGADAPAADVELMATRLAGAMNGPRRVYHTVPHVLEVCEGLNPVQCLAGLFHDMAYHPLDEDFPACFDELPGGLLRPDGEAFRLDLAAAGADQGVARCARLFELADGQLLTPDHGLNEFASALIAARLLQPYLSPLQILAVQACIEATIPFRSTMADGLLGRLRQAVDGLAPAPAEAELRRMVHDAVSLANRDVAGFADLDAGRFLARTWLLIVEANAPLADGAAYSIRDYRQALLRMEGFLSAFDAGRVFHSFEGVPNAVERAALTTAARRNVAFACRYFAIKLIAMALVEAVAMLTGGDCPVADLLGHIRPAADGRPRARIEDHLDPLAAPAPVSAGLLALLELGRPELHLENHTRSPVSAHVYAHLGDAAVPALLAEAKAMFAGRLTPAAFLAATPAPLRYSVLTGCAAICQARRAALLTVRDGLA